MQDSTVWKIALTVTFLVPFAVVAFVMWPGQKQDDPLLSDPELLIWVDCCREVKP